MKNILERLYTGELYPSGKIVPNDPEYQPLTQKICEEQKKLKRQLSEADRESLEHLEELYSMECDMESYANFAYGMKLGIQLMCEVFAEDRTEPRA